MSRHIRTGGSGQRRQLPGQPASRLLAAGAVLTAAGLLLTACSGSPAASPAARASASASAAKAAGPQLTITPAPGSRHARPDHGITVSTSDGKITKVRVRTAGDEVTGTMNATDTAWHSTWALDVSQSYTVTATATDAKGHSRTVTSRFRTLTPAQTNEMMIFEGEEQTYGVGMPIILTFSRPVVNKAAVERSLQVETSKPVTGSWYWDGDQALDFRPENYWPAHTHVSFTGHLNGVQEAPGVYGGHTLNQSFKIGDSLIVVASTSSHSMKLYKNGSLLHRWPISTGKPGDNTPNGTYLTIEKGNPVLMKGPGYRLKVPWSVRFTFSGDYLHDAYWSVNQQGFANVSHGCVNMAPANAKEYYKMAVPGDPVTVIGSPRAGKWDNGWTEWFLSWHKYLKGSALDKAVQAGPDGSTFVDPATVPGPASAPIGAPDPGNWAAA
ncbi:MAG TPA: Ig-like domain-containing protein [Streptosporangiaceae bacterium]